MNSLAASILLVCISSGFAISIQRKGNSVHHGGVAGPMSQYHADCWQKRPVTMMQQVRATVQKAYIPGAGLSPIEPFSTVFFDGFLEAACVKDYMYEHGDKFGNNKFSYEVGSSENVSIVHYTDIVPKEDQEAMTIEVCFEFCRTVPDMAYFGISQGRDCYCEPYYKQMAGDSSMCDSVCEGSPSTMCGGMKKSSVFAMHKCDDTAKNLNAVVSEMTEAVGLLSNLSKKVMALANKSQIAVSNLRGRLCSAIDRDNCQLMKSVKVFTQEFVAPAADIVAFANSSAHFANETTTFASDLDTSKFEDVEEAQNRTQQAKTLVADSEAKIEKLKGLLQMVSPVYPTIAGAPDPVEQYLPLMHFVDPAFEGETATCGGETLKNPLMGMGLNGCARACEEEHGCVGFEHFPEGICLLFYKFSSVKYWTGCHNNGFNTSNSFGYISQCFARLIAFQGRSLKPDPSGNCDVCLEHSKEVKRCY